MNPSQQLGDLQLAIMQVLWRGGEATVGEVHAALQEERGLALTTISTMLVKLELKGVVAHRADGRRFIYYPLISESEVQRSMVGELKQRLFRGDAAALVSHLLKDHDLDSDELARVKSLISAHEEREQAEED